MRQGVSCVIFNFDIRPHDLTQKEQAPPSVTTMLDVLQCALCLCAAYSLPEPDVVNIFTIVSPWILPAPSVPIHYVQLSPNCPLPCRVQDSTQAHTVRNFLIDQKLERAALQPTEDDALTMMRGPLASRRIINVAWSRGGEKAYNKCVF